MLCYIHQKIKQNNLKQLGFRKSFRYAVHHISYILSCCLFCLVNAL
jgi:hypothetical protein